MQHEKNEDVRFEGFAELERDRAEWGEYKGEVRHEEREKPRSIYAFKLPIIETEELPGGQVGELVYIFSGSNDDNLVCGHKITELVDGSVTSISVTVNSALPKISIVEHTIRVNEKTYDVADVVETSYLAGVSEQLKVRFGDWTEKVVS